MAFTANIDFKQYGIDFVCDPETTTVPETLNILSAHISSSDKKLVFTKYDNSQISFILKTKISSGKFGTVYETDNDLVIKKIVYPTNAKNTKEKYKQDVIREALIQIILYECSKDYENGAFVPKLSLIGEDINCFYIVSERMTDTVFSLLNSGKYAIKSIVFARVITEIAFILKESYSLVKFNHRDLHTNNIMWKNWPTIKLIDFGYSCLTYRNLHIKPLSKQVYGSKLKCNSEVRDMHQVMFDLLDSDYLKEIKDGKRIRLTNPVERIVKILCTTDYSEAIKRRNDASLHRVKYLSEDWYKVKRKTWGETYQLYNDKNNISSPEVAINCHPEVVYGAFMSVTFADDLYTPLEPLWAGHLKKLYNDATDLLTDEEYEQVKPEVKDPFLLPFLLKNLASIFSRNNTSTFLASDFKYSLGPHRKLYEADGALIPLLFDELLKKQIIHNVDVMNETILFKFARKSDETNQKRFDAIFDIVIKSSLWKKDFFSVVSSEGQNLYEMSLDYGREKIEANITSYFTSVTAYENMNADDLNMFVSLVKYDYFIKYPEHSGKMLAFFICNKHSFPAESNYSSCLKMFIDKIISSDIKILETSIGINKISRNLLECAMLCKNDIATHLLYVSGADFSSTNKDELFFLLARMNTATYADLHANIIDKYGDMSLINNVRNGETPLYIACINANLAAVRAFVEIPGILYSKQNSQGNTCLHAVTQNCIFENRECKDIIELLLNKYPALADIKNDRKYGPGNPKWVRNARIRTLVKSKKTGWIRHNPNSEKALRTRSGGRLTRKMKQMGVF